MTYAEALAWLSGLRRLGVQLGTERVAEVLRRLGDPQRRFAALHIAGTNGKGSTAALCASVLVEAARAARRAGALVPAVGLYTSPHLLRLTERARLWEDGEALDECPAEELGAALSAVRAAASLAPAQALTFFEAVTAASFLWFAERRAAVVVVETGLGGRLDATRLCEATAACVTSIGLDHVELLGPGLPDIAREKAGVFRPGAPALCACDDEAALAVLAAEARRCGALLQRYGVEIPPVDDDLAAAVPLAGDHQRRNAALALALARCAPPPRGALAEGREVQRAGLRAARWPGRLERVSGPSGEEIWLDAAHNPEGAAALDRWLAARSGPTVVLFGAVEDKQVENMLGPVARAAAVVLCRPPSPRGRAPATVAPLLPGAGYRGPAPLILDEAAHGLAAARALVPPGGRLLVYGSIFLIAEVRRLLLSEPADPVSVQDPWRGRAMGSA